MKQRLNRGFTLIELLVVIAIIGILASVVLAALNSARSKGADAAIKSSINNMRAEAALYYDNNGSSYTNFCTSDTRATQAKTAVNNAGGTWNCQMPNSGADFLISSPLKTNSNLYYCVDSNGAATTTTTAVTGTSTACP